MQLSYLQRPFGEIQQIQPDPVDAAEQRHKDYKINLEIFEAVLYQIAPLDL